MLRLPLLLIQPIPTPFSIGSRYNLHSSRSSNGDGARLHQRVGSVCTVRIHPAPSHQWLRRFHPSCSRPPFLSCCLPPLAVPRALSTLYAVILTDLRSLMRRCSRTYVHSQSTGSLAAPSASTLILPVLLYWRYILNQGPGLDNCPADPTLISYSIQGRHRPIFLTRSCMQNTRERLIIQLVKFVINEVRDALLRSLQSRSNSQLTSLIILQQQLLKGISRGCLGSRWGKTHSRKLCLPGIGSEPQLIDNRMADPLLVACYCVGHLAFIARHSYK